GEEVALAGDRQRLRDSFGRQQENECDTSGERHRRYHSDQLRITLSWRGAEPGSRWIIRKRLPSGEISYEWNFRKKFDWSNSRRGGPKDPSGRTATATMASPVT